MKKNVILFMLSFLIIAVGCSSTPSSKLTISELEENIGRMRNDSIKLQVNNDSDSKTFLYESDPEAIISIDVSGTLDNNGNVDSFSIICQGVEQSYYDSEEKVIDLLIVMTVDLGNSRKRDLYALNCVRFYAMTLEMLTDLYESSTEISVGDALLARSKGTDLYESSTKNSIADALLALSKGYERVSGDNWTITFSTDRAKEIATINASFGK